MDTITRKQALFGKRAKYFTGKPCGRGHVAERFTGNGVCTDCKDEDNALRWNSAKDPAKERRKTELMERGGPRTEDEAKEYSIVWYNRTTDCEHNVVRVGTLNCQLCGLPASAEIEDMLS